jgi:iron complex transport system substrate-binding protein
VTDYCDYPPAARAKPRVGGFTNPSLEAVVAARPDLVILTDDGNPKTIYHRLQTLGIPCHVFRVRRLRELPQGIRELGGVLGVPRKAARLAGQMEKDMAALEKRGRRKETRPPQSALFIIQPEPIVVAGPGTLIHEAFGILGIRNAAADGEACYPKFSIEEMIRRSPDVILVGQGVMSGGSFERLKERLAMLPAVKRGRVCVVTERLYRLSPRAVAGIEEVARCLEVR